MHEATLDLLKSALSLPKITRVYIYLLDINIANFCEKISFLRE